MRTEKLPVIAFVALAFLIAFPVLIIAFPTFITLIVTVYTAASLIVAYVAFSRGNRR